VERGNDIPTKGDRIEQTDLGIRRAGVVWYADQLQVLVKWDDGRSSSLRIGRNGFRIIEDVEQRKAVLAGVGGGAGCGLRRPPYERRAGYPAVCGPGEHQ
jgi:hypothetical protein